MEPEKRGLEDDFPFQTGDFQVPAVGFWGSNHISGTEIALRFKILGISIYLQMDLEIQELIPTWKLSCDPSSILVGSTPRTQQQWQMKVNRDFLPNNIIILVVTIASRRHVVNVETAKGIPLISGFSRVKYYE